MLYRYSYCKIRFFENKQMGGQFEDKWMGEQLKISGRDGN